MSLTGTRWRLALAALAAGLALTFAAGGCSAGTSQDSSGPAAGRDAGVPAPDNAGAPGQDLAAPGGKEAAGAPAKAPDQYLPDSRALIYNGAITVRVSDVDKAAGEARTLATTSGGFVATDERRSDERRSQARVVLRVPSEKFGATVDALAGLGTPESRSLSTQDVTELVVDVDVRIANAQASVDRVRALMARAQTIGEITSVESELSRREADLESLKARKRKLDDLTGLSTLTAVLLGPDAEIDEPKDGFVAGLKTGWAAFVASLRVLVTVLGVMLPWLVALGIPVLLGWWLLRRARRDRPGSAPGPAPAIPVPAGMGAPVTSPPRPAGPPGPVGPPAGPPAARPDGPTASPPADPPAAGRAPN